MLAHQTQMHNLITLTNYKTRLALYSQADAKTATDAPLPDDIDGTLRRIRGRQYLSR